MYSRGIANLIFVWLSVSSSNTASADPANLTHQGETLPVTHKFPGCKDFDKFEKLRQLFREKDEEAIVTFLTRETLTGDCMILREGTMVTVQDVGVWSNTRCVRPRGEPDCYWTITPVIKQPGDK